MPRRGVCDGVEAAAGVRRHIVIGRGEGAVRRAQLQAALAQHAKGVARTVMDQMAIDVEQRLAVGALEDAVTRPDLVEESRLLGSTSRHRISFPSPCGPMQRA
jgi:hypothetical protein